MLIAEDVIGLVWTRSSKLDNYLQASSFKDLLASLGHPDSARCDVRLKSVPDSAPLKNMQKYLRKQQQQILQVSGKR
jgi:hypothetical protein